MARVKNMREAAELPTQATARINELSQSLAEWQDYAQQTKADLARAVAHSTKLANERDELQRENEHLRAENARLEKERLFRIDQAAKHIAKLIAERNELERKSRHWQDTHTLSQRK